MSRVCAYCRSSTNALTREDIWPKCIIARVPSYTARYSERAGKVFSGDLKVKDVCAKCNNGPLSELDSYICDLYDRYFFELPERGQCIDFKYDWSLLGRWLLKISYNSARTSGNDSKCLSKFADVIRGKDTRPLDVSIWLDVVEPAYFGKTTEGGVIEVERHPPAMTRACRIELPDVKTPNYIMRLIAINAFYFYLAIPTAAYSGNVYLNELIYICQLFKGMSILDSDKNVVRAKTTGLTTSSMILPHLQANCEQYETYIKRENKSDT